MISEEEKCDNMSQPEEGKCDTIPETDAKSEDAASQAAEEAAAAASAEENAPAEPTLEEKFAELQDKYLRTLAEYDNYRKRMARELQSTREYAKRSTLSDVIGVYDLLQMAVESSASAQDMAALQAGIKMTFGELQRTLKQLGVEPIDARGQKFDPAIHEAIQMQPSDTVPEGVVLQQWKSGFKLDGSLLRAAVVLVSSGPAKKPEDDDKASAEASEPPIAEDDKADKGDASPSQEG